MVMQFAAPQLRAPIQKVPLMLRMMRLVPLPIWMLGGVYV